MEPWPQAVPFGRYLLKERLARGGMGEVFRAVAVGEAGFEKPVVVKRILPVHAGRSELLELFVAEAKLMTRLAHPNIVQVLDFGRGENGEAFLVLELVQGVDLGRLSRALAVRGEAFPIPLALFIAAQVLRGLHHAHGRQGGEEGEGEGEGGLVHRDVSPGNVLLSTEGEVKVADFGVALVKRPGDRAGGDELVGKPAYMAPEQFDGDDLDPRADLFSVGVVLYQLLTGALPFAGDTFMVQRARIHGGAFRPAGELRAGVSPAVDAILGRALAPERALRFPDARAMAQAIEGLRDQGERLASGDDLAEAVREAMRALPAPRPRVIGLSGSLGRPSDAPEPAPEPDEPERELTRTAGREGVGSFTIRIADGSQGSARIEPSAAASLERATLRIESDASEGTAGARLEPASVSRRAVALGLALGGVVVVLGLGFVLRPRAAPRAAELPMPSAERPVETAAPVVSSLAPRVDPAPSSVPVPIAPLDVVRSPAPVRAALPRASASAAPAALAEPCEGKVRIASQGSWTVSGGPQTVQSPGVYTWRCGGFSLLAVSRADPTQSKATRVTVRQGEMASVDLR